MWRVLGTAAAERDGGREGVAETPPDVVFVIGLEPFAPDTERALERILASKRLRAIYPARALAARGHRAAIVDLATFVDAAPRFRDRPETRIVLGKVTRVAHARTPELVARLCAAVRELAAQRPVHADVCDFLDPATGFADSYVRTILDHCRLTVSTRFLADMLAGRARHPVRVVPDTLEPASARPPRFAPGDPVRLVFFGRCPDPRTTVAAEFVRWLARLRAVGRRLQVTVVCEPNAPVAALSDLSGVALAHVPWSFAAMDAVLAAADLVILPQETGSPWGLAKSHNRLTTALQHGRFPLASPVPAYRDLADFAWIGDDPAEGLAWALANPGAVAERIAAGQAAIEARFGEAAMAAAWIEALDLPGPGRQRGLPGSDG